MLAPFCGPKTALAPGGSEQRCADVGGQSDAGVPQPWVESSQVDPVKLLKRGAPRRKAAAGGIGETGAERGEHARAPVVGRRPAKADENVGGAVVHGGTDELADTEAAGAEHVSFGRCDEFNPGSGGCHGFARALDTWPGLNGLSIRIDFCDSTAGP